MEKPPIISDESLLETTGRKYPDKTNIPLITQRVRAVAQAQRDADVEWYKDKIREIFEEIEKLEDTYVYESCIYGGKYQSLKDKYNKQSIGR